MPQRIAPHKSFDTCAQDRSCGRARGAWRRAAGEDAAVTESPMCTTAAAGQPADAPAMRNGARALFVAPASAAETQKSKSSAT
jgi:hypothetical protein